MSRKSANLITLTSLVALLGASACASDKDKRPERGSVRLGEGTSLAKPPVAAQELSDAFAEVVAQAEPSVVSVYTSKTVQVAANGGMPFPFLFGFPGGGNGNGDDDDQGQGSSRKQQGGGSGFVVDATGYILTNAHVVKDQDEIKVELFDRTRLEAKVVGLDEKADVAVLKVELGKAKLRVMAFGNSDDLRIGQWVLAMGSPYMFRNTVTAGIVSAVGRNEMQGDGYSDYIQTDAAVNPGNSGGPLVNLRGQVVGINSSIWTRSGGYQGISFAIPINQARRIAEDLIYDGSVSRGWLGLSIDDVDPELADALSIPGRNGARVMQAVPGAPADKAGVKTGDIVLSLAGKPVTGSADLRNRVAAERPGTKVTLRVLRDGKELDIVVPLGRLGDTAPESFETADGETNPIENMDGTYSNRRFGLQLSDLTENDRNRLGLPKGAKGALVSGVAAESPAAEKGLREGMLVVAMASDRQEHPVGGAKELAKLLAKVPAGGTVALKVQSKDRIWLVGLRAREGKK
jgi:serine protease Do